jgi:hypothetical protein
VVKAKVKMTPLFPTFPKTVRMVLLGSPEDVLRVAFEDECGRLDFAILAVDNVGPTRIVVGERRFGQIYRREELVSDVFIQEEYERGI